MAQQAKRGDTVSVHYTGKLEDGTVFDSSRDGDPIEFEIGSDSVIEGFENAVEGMEVGQQRETRVPPEEAYGDRKDELSVEVPKERLPDTVEPEQGQLLEVEVSPGQRAVAQIVGVNDGQVTLDLNHPLAGQTLVFDVELVNIQS